MVEICRSLTTYPVSCTTSNIHILASNEIILSILLMYRILRNSDEKYQSNYLPELSSNMQNVICSDIESKLIP
jgi:hypothetical protein